MARYVAEEGDGMKQARAILLLLVSLMLPIAARAAVSADPDGRVAAPATARSDQWPVVGGQ